MMKMIHDYDDDVSLMMIGDGIQMTLVGGHESMKA
jgi:hypothetical protein